MPSLRTVIRWFRDPRLAMERHYRAKLIRQFRSGNDFDRAVARNYQILYPLRRA